MNEMKSNCEESVNDIPMIPIKAVMVNMTANDVGVVMLKDFSNEVIELEINYTNMGIIARLLEPEEFLAVRKALACPEKWHKVVMNEMQIVISPRVAS